jgi:hypothetical protein
MFKNKVDDLLDVERKDTDTFLPLALCLDKS